MRRSLLAVVSAIGATLVALGAATASGGCSSLPDLHFEADASALFPDEGGQGEGGIDPNCKRTGPEVCNDGIDNDCNGRVDCQDFACRQQGFSCQDVPAGWTAVAFSPDGRPSCPFGALAVDLKVAAGDSTATCMCSCDPVGGSCTSGNYTITSASDGACSATPVTKTVPVDSAACTPLGTPLALATRAMLTVAGPTSCSLTAALNGALTDGRLCQVEKAGAGCGSNQACAARASSGLTTCVTTAGKSACPPSFPRRSTAGTSATDTRSCSGCACDAPTGCTGGSVSLYDSFMCKTNGGFQHADNITSTCNALGPDSSFSATFFKSTPPTGGGCAAPTNAGTVTGAVSFADERTVCCP